MDDLHCSTKLSFMPKFMLHTFQTFSRSNNANRFLELLLRVLRVQTEVFGPGVQILQHYSEVIGPGGGPNTSKYLDREELFQGGPFFP